MRKVLFCDILCVEITMLYVGESKLKIEDIKKVIVQNKVKWSTHCLERMQERDISRAR